VWSVRVRGHRGHSATFLLARKQPRSDAKATSYWCEIPTRDANSRDMVKPAMDGGDELSPNG
jgi:hypothetical protein